MVHREYLPTIYAQRPKVRAEAPRDQHDGHAEETGHDAQPQYVIRPLLQIEEVGGSQLVHGTKKAYG